MNILQSGEKKRIPDRCGCGRKGKFRQLSEENIDFQEIIIEDEDIEKTIELKGKFKEIMFGMPIIVVGIVKTKEVAKESIKKMFYIAANNLIPK